jgi:DNA repair protein RadA/Sms
MAKKNKTVFMCKECGYESPKWQGRCICGAWNSFVEVKVPDISEEDPRRRTFGGIGKGSMEGQSQSRGLQKHPSKLAAVDLAEHGRIDSGIGEVNRVLGGGLVKGSLVLLSGEPGIGKSTIIMQIASRIAAEQRRVLYISGEESEGQIRLRADRICGEIPEDLYVLAETNMESIEVACDSVDPEFLIIDSIQTMYTEDLDSAPGSVSQVRACGNLLMRMGKTREIPVLIVAHVTKSGELAGPKTVEHLVDCVLSFTGERDNDLRILRAYKNRFGTTSEIGAFRMEEEGLVEIGDLSSIFVGGRKKRPEGSVISAVYEGSRPVLFEIQALTASANVGFARRTAVGVDSKRLAMIIAVLERKIGLRLIDRDVYVNVAGGLKPESTSVDLAVALAIYSSLRAKVAPKSLIAVGEISLTGDLRPVAGADKIAEESSRMKYDRLILPETNLRNFRFRNGKSKDKDGIEILGVPTLAEAIKAFEK